MTDALRGYYYNVQDYHRKTTNILCTKVTPERHRMSTKDGRKLSKLQLLQEDYRSQLLHEKEQKLNVLFERKVRENLLPKQGSVREFFKNRRKLATSTSNKPGPPNPAVNLPPITLNSRYNNARHNKRIIVKEKRSESGKEVEKVYPEESFKDEQFYMHLGDRGTTGGRRQPSREPEKLRQDRQIQRRHKSQRPVELAPARFSDRQTQREDQSPNFVSTWDKERTNNTGDMKNLERNSRPKEDKGVYKRTGKSKLRCETFAGEQVSESFEGKQSVGDENELSRSLVKIKELSRRKTEEFLMRTMNAKLATESEKSQESSRGNNIHTLDEMSKLEAELRETISREKKKLLALQQRKREVLGERYKEIDNNKPASRSAKIKESKTPKLALTKRSKEVQKVHGNWENKALQENLNKRPSGASVETQDWKQSVGVRSEKEVVSKSQPVVDLSTCSNCGRGFMKKRISKHEMACRKASARTKKPFDAKRKRAEGTEMEKYLIMGRGTTNDSETKKKKQNWRIQHENFIQTIRYAKGLEDSPPPALTNPDYVACSYCQRKFKPSVAERHIPKCKDIRARPKPPKR